MIVYFLRGSLLQIQSQKVCDVRSVFDEWIENINYLKFNFVIRQMSEGFRTYEGLSTLRPIIPTLTNSANSLRIESAADVENNTLLKHCYQNYLRLIKQNYVLSNQLKIINNEKQQLQERLEQLKNDQEGKKKRPRRNASEIIRNFNCPVQECGKTYGSEGSLLQHIKLKHKQFYESEEYQKLLLSKNKKKQEIMTKIKKMKGDKQSNAND